MHLTTAAVACLLSALPAAAAGGATSIRTANVAPQKGVDFGILEGPKNCGGSPRSSGVAHISQEFANKLMRQIGFLPISPAGGNIIQTSLLTETTELHSDHRINKEPVDKGTPIAFVTVNSNDDAYFSQGDARIPIVEGQLIQFDGSVEHNTVIESGVVMLLGPFELPSFNLVGLPIGPACNTRDVDDCCSEGLEFFDPPGDGDGFSSECFLCPEADGGDSRALTGKGGGKRGKKKQRRHKPNGNNDKDTCNLKCVSIDEGAGNDSCAECSVPTPPPNLYPFIPGRLEDVATTPERLVEIVNDLEGNMDGSFGLSEDLISLNECAVLRDYADSELEEAILLQDGDKAEEEGANIQEDFRLEVSPSQLGSLIGLNTVQSLLNAFKDYHTSDFPLNRVFIRRTSLSGDKHMQYHNDGDTAVMHIWLNEDDIDGGNLVYLTRDGATKVDGKPGRAALHGDSIVHGITPLKGTRYILILLGDNKVTDDVLEEMVSVVS